MSHENRLAKTAAYLAGIYKRSPVKPFNKILSKLYFNVLNSGQNRSVVHKCIDGINFELDLREVIDSEMFYVGSREPNTTKTLQMLCQPGDVVFDIGANVGSHSLPVASLVGEFGRVYSFEPVPWAMAKLKRNLSLNRFNNVVTEQVALSDENISGIEMEFRASFKLEAPQGVDSQGQIDNGWWQECDRVVTKMQTLDSYVAERGIDRVNLIKLDVDGFEGKVIRGALNTLRKHKPTLIMEIAPAWVEMRGDSAIAIGNQLAEIGYRCFTEVAFEEFSDIEKMISGIRTGGGMNVVFSARQPQVKSPATRS